MNALAVVSTDDVRLPDRLALWGESVWKLLGRLRSDAYGDEHFSGRMIYGDLGDLRLCRLSASRHRVVRTPDLIRQDDRGFLKLVVQLSGTTWFEQNGRKMLLSPGEWSIYDTMQSYTVSNANAIEQLVVLVPREKVLARGLSPKDLMVQRYSARAGVGRLACNLMGTAFDEMASCGSNAAQDVADAISRLVGHSLLERAGIQTPLTIKECMRDRIKAFIESNLRDPRLSIDQIATLCNCSKRNLHKVFQEEGTTISQYIWRRRLEACRRDLDNPGCADKSITDIAYSWGFSSSTHFSRSFKAAFDVSPRLHRMARLSLV